MTGKLKILSLSKDIEGLKAKRSYINANIHFRDLNSHTLTLKSKKEYRYLVIFILVRACFISKPGYTDTAY